MSTQTVMPQNGAVLQTVTVEQANEIDAKAMEFSAQAPTLMKQAQDFTIEEKSDYEFSLTICEEAIRRQKAIKEYFAPTKRLADQLHASICAMEKNLLAPYVQVETLIKGRRQDWRDAQEQIRLKKEADDRRKAQEEQQARALEEAAQLEKEGEKEAAQVVVEQALAAPPPAVVVPSSVPKQTGSSVRGSWDFRYDDPDQVQREYCSPDDKKIRAIVKSLGKSSPIKGITVFWKENEAIQTKGR
jgi:hypothetical protein